MVVNFGSIRGKIADLAVTLENYHPDIIIGTETHLNSSINSSELFPPDFSVYRRDRTPVPQEFLRVAYSLPLEMTSLVPIGLI